MAKMRHQNKLKTALKSDSPDWAAVQKEAKLFAFVRGGAAEK